MSILNKKEFHLLFTIMSDEQYFNLLCKKIFFSYKEFVLIILNSLFAETDGLAKIKPEPKDQAYYNMYTEYVNITTANDQKLKEFGFTENKENPNEFIRPNGSKFEPF